MIKNSKVNVFSSCYTWVVTKIIKLMSENNIITEGEIIEEEKLQVLSTMHDFSLPNEIILYSFLKKNYT